MSAHEKAAGLDGLIQRQPFEHDRRLVQPSLTGKGRTEIARAFDAHNRREHLWGEALSPEEQATMSECSAS